MEAAGGPVEIRKATREDADALIGLIIELAHFEKLVPPDADAQRRLVEDGFGPRPRYDAYLAFADGVACGYAFVFETYSTFLALPTLYLEDIFVKKEFRGRGAGLALFRKVVEEARDRGCGRLDFVVLDWNTGAQDFYKRLGVKHLDNWYNFRLTRVGFAGLLESTSASQEGK